MDTEELKKAIADTLTPVVESMQIQIDSIQKSHASRPAETAEELNKRISEERLKSEGDALHKGVEQWVADKKQNPHGGKALNIKSDNESSNDNLTGKKL